MIQGNCHLEKRVSDIFSSKKKKKKKILTRIFIFLESKSSLLMLKLYRELFMASANKNDSEMTANIPTFLRFQSALS